MNAAAAFFDLDRTIVGAATERLIASRLFRRGLLSAPELCGIVWAYFKYDAFLAGDYERMKRSVVRAALGGKSVESIHEVVREVLTEAIEPRIFPQARQAVLHHQERGEPVCIVSSAVDVIVEPIASALGAQHSFSTRLMVHDGRYTGEVGERIHAGEQKSLAVEEFAQRAGIDLYASHAYGDHYDDRFMLSAVGNPVAVNPDRRLLQFARSHGWNIARWRHGR